MRRIVCALMLSTLALPMAAQAPPKPAFVVTLNGDRFAMKELTFAPMVATYTNNVWRSGRNPRVNRIALDGLAERGLATLTGKFSVVRGRDRVVD